MTQRLLLFAIAMLGTVQFAQAQFTPLLLKDINTAPASFGSYNMDPAGFVQMDGITYYTGYTANSGRQLWRTDGSSVGTRVLTNNAGLNWEINYSIFEIPSSLTAMNGNLYFFTANKEPGYTNSFNLVRSDTAGHTGKLAGSSAQASAALTKLMLTETQTLVGDAARRKMVVFGNNLYFAFSDLAHGIELWKSDGTAAGTAMLKDLDGNAASSSPMNFTVVGSTLFFTTTNPDRNISLWKSDGTATGTVKIRDSVATSDYARSFIAINNKLYFLGCNQDLGIIYLWKSDGSTAGTIAIDQIPSIGGLDWYESLLMKQGSNAIYSLNSDLKKYDGSSTTTLSSSVKRLNTSGRANQWAEINGTLYFAGQNISTSSSGLWKTDGTPGGTVAVKEGLTTLNYLNAGGTLYFAGNDNSGAGMELWKSNGTASGTVRLSDFNTDPAGFSGDGIIDLSTDYPMVYQNGKVLLGAFNGVITPIVSVSLLAASDGTTSGTGFVAPASAVNYGSYPAAKTVWNNNLYFSAFTPAAGSELWRTDGTPAGTVMISDLNPGSASSYIQSFTPYKGSLYFLTSDTAGGYLRDALWKTDGTAAGTVKVIDGLGHEFYGNCKMGVSGSVLFVTAGGSVYISDGTAAGTVHVPIRFPGASIESIAGNFAFLNSNTAIVSALNNVSGIGTNELWNVDLSLKTATRYATGQMQHTEMLPFDGAIYFVRQQTSSSSSNFVLWKTNGTPTGTSIADLTVSPHYLTVMNNGADLYYVGTDAGVTTSSVMRLPAGGSPVTVKSWNDLKTAAYEYDNTYRYYWLQPPQISTEYIHNLYPEAYPFFIKPTAGGPVYMPAGDAGTGIELFTTDGTPGGTAMVKDIRPDSFSSGPQYLTPIVNKQGDTLLAFVANDGARGAEIWISNGAVAGTQSFTNPLDGSSSLNPRYLTLLNGKLIFWGTSLEYGTEPYAYELQQVLQTGGPKSTALNLQLYPNPADHTITVRSEAGSKIEVFNLAGIRVLEATAATSNTALSIGGLAPGMYTVRVRGNSSQQAGRFIKL